MTLLQEGSYFSEDAMQARAPQLHHDLVGRFQDLSDRLAPRSGERLCDLLLRRTDELAVRRGLGLVDEGEDGYEEEERGEEEMEEAEEEEESEEEEGGRVGKGEEVRESKDESKQPERPAADQDGSAVVDQRHAAIPEGEREGGREGEGEGGGADGGVGVENAEEGLIELQAAMQERFLAGKDEGVDYGRIDADVTLDDDWLAEAGRDAEEKYFDDD